MGTRKVVGGICRCGRATSDGHRKCDKCLADSLRWKLAHPEQRRKVYREWAMKNPDKCKAAAQRCRLKKMGTSVEELAKLAQKQNGCCRICQRPTKLVVDHDHATGRFRGLLCSPCNFYLGMIRDDLAAVQRMCQYLQ